MIVLRAIRPRLLLMLHVRAIVPPLIPHEPAIHPRHMQHAVVPTEVPAVHIRVAVHTGERRADELPDSRGSAIQVQVVRAEPSFAVAEGQEEDVGAGEAAETRVGYVAEVRVGAGQAGQVGEGGGEVRGGPGVG